MKTVVNNFQRAGSISNSHVGRAFEALARDYFQVRRGWVLTPNFPVILGAGQAKKSRTFDLGSKDPPILVECKCHRWTDTKKTPSAKMRDWTQAMYRFHLAPTEFRKILFVTHDIHPKTNRTLADYYVLKYADFIPNGVSIIEFDEQSGNDRIVIE